MTQTGIQAVIFDCYGVLVTEGWIAFKERYFGQDEARLQQAVDLRTRVDRGMYDHAAFFEAMAQLADVSVETVHHYLSGNVANEVLFDYIRDFLKPYYKIGMLSNAGANVLNDLFTAAERQLFDATVLSYAVGVAKPEGAAYEAAAAALGLQPKQCVMVDDQERHCVGAEAVGMRALQYVSQAQFVQDVERLLSVEHKR